MNLEYVIVKIWRRNASENVQTSNKMGSQINVATDNVTSQCFYVKERKSSDNSYLFLLVYFIEEIRGIPVEKQKK